MGLPFESWRADVPLGDFEGVSVGEDDGLVVGLDFRGKNEVSFKLGDFALLVSLKKLNMKGNPVSPAAKKSVAKALKKRAKG